MADIITVRVERECYRARVPGGPLERILAGQNSFFEGDSDQMPDWMTPLSTKKEPVVEPDPVPSTRKRTRSRASDE